MVAPSAVKLIAYYLPQFHPIPENDAWWGKGFTEWTNVTQAKAYFDGHYQPHLPSDLGFYDLRLPQVREAQAQLARDHGIHGFCYYYYWFAGRRLLEYPLQAVFDSQTPDFPFCICWANENWTRRWDGLEQEILLEQTHSEDTDVAFINDVIPLLKDSRYIRLNGAPLLIVYRISLLPNPAQTAARWREICSKNGIPRIHLCVAETPAQVDPAQFGFDSAVQFPPHGIVAPLENANIPSLAAGFEGLIFDMVKVAAQQIVQPAPPYKRFPAVMGSWDNTARKKKSGWIFLNGTPDNYAVWLRAAMTQSRERLPQGEQLVFVNAWNEWAEGAHLEPDLKYGRGFLEATLRAVKGNMPWREVVAYAKLMSQLSGDEKDWVIEALRAELQKNENQSQHLLENPTVAENLESLLALEGIDFIQMVYRVFLKRPADDEGAHNFLRMLGDSGSKIEVIDNIRFSPEGQGKAVELPGLGRRQTQATKIKARRFVIVGHPRTGSTLLRRILNQHPDILMFSELFHPVPSERSGEHAVQTEAGPASFQDHGEDALNFLDRLVWTETNSNAAIAAIGFKLFAHHVECDGTSRLFSRLKEAYPDIYVVHLLRENLLDMWLSKTLAEQSGVWTMAPGADRAVYEALPPFSADPQDLRSFFDKTVEQTASIKDCFSSGNYLEVTYANLSNATQKTASEVFEFLGASNFAFSMPLQKQNLRSPQDMLANYAQLKAFFQQPIYGTFFE